MGAAQFITQFGEWLSDGDGAKASNSPAHAAPDPGEPDTTELEITDLTQGSVGGAARPPASSGTKPAEKSGVSDTERVATGRARRLLSMSLLQLVVAALTVAAFAAPWYTVTLEAPRVVAADGTVHQLSTVVASASAFVAVSAASTSPHCPPVPAAYGLPIPVVAVLAAALLGLLAGVLRSPVLAAGAVFAALQGFRHLAVLHAAVVAGPAGCLPGELSVGVGRSVAVAGTFAVLLLTGLGLWQVVQVRNAEKAAKLARGETVPPSLIELVQNRVIGLAGAVVAEAQRR
jgi:hypothetical protein